MRKLIQNQFNSHINLNQFSSQSQQQNQKRSYKNSISKIQYRKSIQKQSNNRKNITSISKKSTNSQNSYQSSHASNGQSQTQKIYIPIINNIIHSNVKQNNLLLLNQSTKRLYLTYKKQLHLSHPYIYQIMSNSNIFYEIKQIENQNIKSYFIKLINSGMHITLIQQNNQIDSDLYRSSSIAYLIRYRSQAKYIKNTPKKVEWQKTLQNQKKSRQFLENNHQIFYLPPSMLLLQGMLLMLQQLAKSQFKGYIALFMPDSRQSQFFFLEVLQNINRIYIQQPLTFKYFQFILFQTNKNYPFQNIIKKVQDQSLPKFNRKWYYFDNGSRKSYGYQTSLYIQSQLNEQIYLFSYMLQKNKNDKFQLDVSSGKIRQKQSKALHSRFLFDQNQILYLDLGKQLPIRIPKQQLKRQPLSKFIQNFILKQKQIKQHMKKQSTNKQKNQKAPCKTQSNQNLKQMFQSNIKQEWVDLGFMVYLLSKRHKKQCNLFTGYSRTVDFLQFARPDFQIKNNKTVAQVQFYYPKQSQMQVLKMFQKTIPNSYYPLYWERDKQTSNCKLITVKQGTPEHNEIAKKFKLSKKFKLKRIQNQYLLKKYYFEKQRVQNQQNGQKIKQRLLFYSTKKKQPQLLFDDKSDSFNKNFAEEGIIGKGFYFAKNAIYCHKFAHINDDNEFCLLLNIVLIGQSKQIEYLKNEKIKVPERNKNNLSFLINVNGDKIYTVFESNRAYPLYMITYNL